MSESAISVFKRYLKDFNSALAGKEVDPFSHFAANAKIILTGHTPMSGTFHSVADMKAHLFSTVAKLSRKGKDFGFQVETYIGQGNRVVALARGRGETEYAPYNNSYFILFEVQHGKIVEVIEDCDSSLIMRAFYNLAPVDA